MRRIRPRWWTELPLIVTVYVAYSACRILARGDTSTAVDHGLAILGVEQVLWLNAEHLLNRLFTERASLGIPAAFYYATLHYLVTPAILVWVWRRASAHYRAVRTWLLISTLVALVGFALLPTSPPRLLGTEYGFVDTMAQYGSYGWWGNEASAPRGLGELTNQYAAMPSLHVGWAVWCGAVLWQFAGRSRLARTAAVAYPSLTTVVVLGTANHYLLDAVAGAAVMGLGLLLARPVGEAAQRVTARLRTADARRPQTAQAAGAPAAVPGTATAPTLAAATRTAPAPAAVTPPTVPTPTAATRTAPAPPAGTGAGTAPTTANGIETQPTHPGARPGTAPAGAGQGPAGGAVSAMDSGAAAPDRETATDAGAAAPDTETAANAGGDVCAVSTGCHTAVDDRIPRQRQGGDAGNAADTTASTAAG